MIEAFLLSPSTHYTIHIEEVVLLAYVHRMGEHKGTNANMRYLTIVRKKVLEPYVSQEGREL